MESSRVIGASVSGPQPTSLSQNHDEGGLFNEAVAAERSGEGYFTRAWANVMSSFTEDGFHYLAHHGYEIEDDRIILPGTEDDFISTNANSGATMTVVFRVDEPVRYTFEHESRRLQVDPSADNNDSPLFFLGGESGGYVDDEGTAILSAGTYELRWGGGAHAVVGTTERRVSEWEYDLSLTFSPLDGGGEGPTAIPLPPAAWSGLVVLGGVALNRLRRKLVA